MSKIPRKNKEDLKYKLQKAAISAIPYIGGPAAEFFSSIIIPPIEKRRNDQQIQLHMQQLWKAYERAKEVQDGDIILDTYCHCC